MPPVAPMRNDPMLGRVVEGKYRIDAVIGFGGMATVYRTTRLHIGDTVAMKILREDLLREPKFAERFRREAQAAAQLKHPNVVAVYDFGVASDGIVFLVMELVEGRTLREIIKERAPMLALAATTIVRQICGALAEAHRRDIVHRDVKPANIVVDEPPDGVRVKVLDFGIASLRGGTTMTFTETGAVLGTPAYMSPEQCLGEDLDGRSDIYSLGVVLFEMLCGVVPFNSPTATAVVMQHVQQAPPPLRVLNVSIPESVERVVLRAMAKRREDRQQSARELADEFSAAAGSPGGSLRAPDETIVTPRPSPGHSARTIVQEVSLRPPPREPARRGGRTAAAIVGACVVAILGGTWLGAHYFSAPRAAPSDAANARPAPARRQLAAAPAANAASASAPASSARATQAVAGDPHGILALLRSTGEMDVFGSLGCDAPDGVRIRFKDDGSGGCALYREDLEGMLESGAEVTLIPVTAPGRGTIYDLLYTDEGDRERFLGILPGDGSGDLRVSLQNGLIAEQNGARVKLSTLRGSRVVVISSGAR